MQFCKKRVRSIVKSTSIALTFALSSVPPALYAGNLTKSELRRPIVLTVDSKRLCSIDISFSKKEYLEYFVLNLQKRILKTGIDLKISFIDFKYYSSISVTYPKDCNELTDKEMENPFEGNEISGLVYSNPKSIVSHTYEEFYDNLIGDEGIRVNDEYPFGKSNYQCTLVLNLKRIPKFPTDNAWGYAGIPAVFSFVKSENGETKLYLLLYDQCDDVENISIEVYKTLNMLEHAKYRP